MRKALSSRNTQLHSFKPNLLVPRRRGVPQLRLFQFERNIDASQRSSHSLKAVGTDTGRDPEDVRGAIAVGLQLYEDKNYQEALKVFEKALNLPGTGLKRFRYCIGKKNCSRPGLLYSCSGQAVWMSVLMSLRFEHPGVRLAARCNWMQRC